MSDPYKMEPEALLEHMAGLVATQTNDIYQLEKGEKILNAKLLLRVAESLSGLGSGLEQLRSSLNSSATWNKRHSWVMAGLTAMLVIGTCVLAKVGWRQADLLEQYTLETQRLAEVAGEQLRQSQRVSAIVNRPYLEAQPIDLVPTGQADPKDATSFFYQLVVELTNHSDLPAVGVSISDFRFESPSRGVFTLTDVPVEAESLTVFPRRSPKVVMTFVMNPETVSRYLKGEEECHIRMRVAYGSTQDVRGTESLWYEGRWTYRRGQFIVNDSKADFGGGPAT